MAVRKTTAKKGHATEHELRQGLNEYVSTSLDLDGVDLRVYLYLSARLDFESPAHVPQIEIAEALGRQKTHISRAVRNLVQAGVIVPGPDGTRASQWLLSRDYGT
jgi:predicted transcriptional regulator